MLVAMGSAWGRGSGTRPASRSKSASLNESRIGQLQANPAAVMERRVAPLFVTQSTVSHPARDRSSVRVLSLECSMRSEGSRKPPEYQAAFYGHDGKPGSVDGLPRQDGNLSVAARFSRTAVSVNAVNGRPIGRYANRAIVTTVRLTHWPCTTPGFHRAVSPRQRGCSYHPISPLPAHLRERRRCIFCCTLPVPHDRSLRSVVPHSETEIRDGASQSARTFLPAQVNEVAISSCPQEV